MVTPVREWVGGPRLRSALRLSSDQCGRKSAGRTRRSDGEGEREREGGENSEEKDRRRNKHGHGRRLQLMCEAVSDLRLDPPSGAQLLRYVGQAEDKNVRERRKSSEILLLSCAALSRSEGGYI